MRILAPGTSLALAVILVASGALANWSALPDPAEPSLAARTPAASEPVTSAAKQGILDAFDKLPLSFIPNAGQTDTRVRYYTHGAGYGFYFFDDKAALAFAKPVGHKALRTSTLELRFAGARVGAAPRAERRQTARISYLRGSEPSKWRTNISTYEQVVYEQLWNGIDMRFRGGGGALKYEFAIRPGARVDDIRLAYEGAERVSLGEAGQLLIQTPLGVLTDLRPYSYQQVDGRTVPIATQYVLERAPGGQVFYGFDAGSGYDPRYPLVIDPGLDYSSYLGGPGTSNFFCECGRSVAVDAQGHAFVSGQALEGFPTTAGAFQEDIGGTGQGVSGADAFVAEFDPGASGSSSLLYATYLGGSDVDASPSIAVRSNGNVVVGIGTNSPDFPVTATAFQAAQPGGGFDAAVVELDLSASGSDVLVYSTYLGGSRFDGGTAVAAGAGSRIVARLRTRSKDFPTTADAYQMVYGGGDLDAAVAVLDSAASGSTSLVYSTYLGGSGTDGATTGGLAVDGQGHVFLSDTTDSSDFPVTSGAYRATKSGGFDAYVVELDPAVPGSNGLLYSTYLGGASTDAAPALALGAAGHVLVSGRTSSTDLPVTGNAFQSTYGGGSSDSFVAEIDSAVSGAAGLLYASYLGGSGADVGEGLAADGEGHPIAVGTTSSANFPVTKRAFQSSLRGSRDAFVAELDTVASGRRSLVYSSYLGGSSSDRGLSVAVDGLGRAYVTGDTNSTNFPVTAGAFQRTFAGFSDAFLTVFPAN
jgi:hypothetical protein